MRVGAAYNLRLLSSLAYESVIYLSESRRTTKKRIQDHGRPSPFTTTPHACWTAIKLTGRRCQLQRLWVRIPALAWSVHDWGETPEQGTEPPTAPQAPQCRLPTAPLGWVKCREHISLLIILCIIVYVTNKAHLSLIWNTYIFNIL